MTAREIAQILAGRNAHGLTDGSFLVPCPVPSHGKGRGDRNPSLRIGDGASHILVRCFAGCDPRDVLDALRRRGLIESTPRSRVSSGGRTPPEESAPDPGARGRQQQYKARWLWSKRQPIAGTIAETYLCKRGIACRLPSTLGFLPASDKYPPAMIAAFGCADEPEPGVLAAPADVCAIHLTRLLPDGSDRERGDKAKIMLGRSVGLPIVLAAPNDLLGLAVCEGIEDALTVHQATGLGAWAAGSAGRMPSLADNVPSFIEAVTIFAHADKAGQDGASHLAKKLHERGIEVRTEGVS